MTTEIMPHLSLLQAKTLVKHLEAEQIVEANKIIESIDFLVPAERDMFGKVGELTRELHDALLSFQNDTRLIDMAGKELPDAQDRLNYVIEMTSNAANKTMDAVELCLPIADKFIANLDAVSPSWERLMTRKLALGDFKSLCHSIDALFHDSRITAADLRSNLTDILMAQDFQDLTGQMIKRVIDLVQEIEVKLVLILKVCSTPLDTNEAIVEKLQERNIVAEGPIMNVESRDDVVNGQDDVDDLLSSLGF